MNAVIDINTIMWGHVEGVDRGAMGTRMSIVVVETCRVIWFSGGKETPEILIRLKTKTKKTDCL